MRSFFVVVVLGLLASSVSGEEKPVELKRAPGLHEVEVNCSGCHSLDYISMNSRFLDAAGWDVVVTKMINAFGAPIDPEDAKVIKNYLRDNYGTIETSSAPPGAMSTPSRKGASKEGEEVAVTKSRTVTSARPVSGGTIHAQRQSFPLTAGSTGSRSHTLRPPSNQQVTRQRPNIISWAEAMRSAQRTWPGRSLCDDGGYRIHPCDVGGGGGGGGDGGGGGGGGGGGD